MSKQQINYDKLNYGIYCRKSSETEDRQVQSLETQLRELSEHAKRNELNIVEVIQESKSAFTVGREGFSRMKQLIESGKINALLVINANRISRNPIDSADIIHLLDLKKLLYVRTPSTCYTSSTNDKLMLGLQFLMSKADSDGKGDAVKDGQKTKAIKGYPHGVASLGFLNDKTEEKGNRKWLVDKERFPKIKLIFKKYLAGGISGNKLREYAVKDLGLTTAKHKKIGGQPISKSRIFYILKDPIYAGFFYQDGERYELNKSLPRIITESEHNKILRMLGIVSTPRSQNHQTLYSGLIKAPEGYILSQDVKLQAICDCKNKFSCASVNYCPKCNKEIKDMENPKILNYCYYYDARLKKKGIKKYPNVSEKVIDESLKDYIQENFILPPSLAEWSRKYISELKDSDLEDTLILEMNYKNEKVKYEEEKARAREMLRDQFITNEEYKMDIERIDNKYNFLNKKSDPNNVDWLSKLNQIIDLNQSILNILENGTFIEKREALFSLGTNLTLKDKNLYFSWDKSIETLISGLNLIKSELRQYEPKITIDNIGLKEKTDEFSPVFSTMLRGQGSNLRPIG